MPAATAQWAPLGPDGGDVRSLAADPRIPGRVYLGTSAGQLFVSEDSGHNWTRLAHLGPGDDYVLDHVVANPDEPGVLYAAAWSVVDGGGDVFRSSDGGRSWQALPGMHGESIRAFAMDSSDPKVLVAGTLDGVYRSMNGGDSWQLISPPHDAEIKNVESVAIDPRSPDVIYAGTWHLAWKTYNGGRTWQNIKRGVVDDSDVFSILVDRSNARHVYMSACTGIYMSDDDGQQFRKVQGIPDSARRTRVLRQDPANAGVVYAGTTEGLWKTVDGGRTWTRLTPANVIVNDVLVDRRHPARVLLATDRAGVLASDDAGQTFVASNRGFAHRQVSALVADREDASTLYAGVVNDKEFGGAFVSHDGGLHWRQMSDGLDGRDVFCLHQADNGNLLAGTNDGVFRYDLAAQRWEPMRLILSRTKIVEPVRRGRAGKKKLVRDNEWLESQMNARVAQIATTAQSWFVATSAGLYTSLDQGQSWHAAPLPAGSFVSVAVRDADILAATPTAVYRSRDGGQKWARIHLPSYATAVSSVALSAGETWVVTREGGFFLKDGAQQWQHVIAGTQNIAYLSYDRANSRLLSVSGSDIFESRDGGETWKSLNASVRGMRAVSVAGNRVLGITAFDGVVAQISPEASSSRAAGSANNQ